MGAGVDYVCAGTTQGVASVVTRVVTRLRVVICVGVGVSVEKIECSGQPLASG
jgi:hypothetical protein